MSLRIGAIAARYGRRLPFVRNASTAMVLTATGVVVWNQQSQLATKLESSHQIQQPLSSLVIPTLEATLRVQRLVLTAVMIVWDYESAKLSAKLHLDKGSKEKLKWEEERNSRQRELEDAQKSYTDESASSGLRPSEYRELVRMTRPSCNSASVCSHKSYVWQYVETSTKAAGCVCGRTPCRG